MRSFHIDLPIAVALLGGFSFSALNSLLGREYVYFDSVTILTFLLLVGRYVQSKAIARARDEAGRGWDFLPRLAHTGGPAPDAVAETVERLRRRLAELVPRVRELGYPGIAQTSWGPTLAVVCPSEVAGRELMTHLRREAPDVATTLAAPLNRGVLGHGPP